MQRGIPVMGATPIQVLEDNGRGRTTGRRAEVPDDADRGAAADNGVGQDL